MNEGKKTGIFWGTAVVIAGLAAIVARPQRERDVDKESMVGRMLFESFSDAEKAAKLRIVRFDEAQAGLSSFEVAKNRETGLWTIPSASGYPADAAEQMKKAALAFQDKEILDIVSDDPKTHAEFGVVEPKADSLEVGQEGVGMLVEIQDEKGTDLVELIVGDEVPKSNKKQYFVRKPNQDRVYVVKLETTPLSTKFTDWIEKDLLKLSSLDVREVELKDYSVVVSVQGGSLARNFEAKVAIDDSSKWSLKNMTTFGERGKPQPDVGMPPGQELDTTKLNELKSALDDLKISGVRRKPEGLSSDLKTDASFMTNRDSMRSLNSRGFYPQPTADGKGEVYAANGELLVTLKDGVEYLLRFGEIASFADESEEPKQDEESAEKTDADKDSKKDEVKDPSGLNRFMLVTARINEALFPPAELAEVPQTLEDLDRLDAAKKKPKSPVIPAATDSEPNELPIVPEAPPSEGEKPAPASETPKSEPSKEGTDPAVPTKDEPEVQPIEPSKEDDPKNDSAGTAEASGSGTVSGSGAGALVQDQTAGETKAEAAANETPVPAASTDKSEVKPGDETKVVEQPESEAPKATTPAKDPSASEKPASKEETLEEKKERLEAEKERITKENQRKIDERKDKLGAAEKKVRELNMRFADWFYVVPESTYRKLRLGREQLFKTSQPAVPSAGPGITAPTQP